MLQKITLADLFDIVDGNLKAKNLIPDVGIRAVNKNLKKTISSTKWECRCRISFVHETVRLEMYL